MRKRNDEEFDRKVNEFDRKLLCEYLVPVLVSIVTTIIVFYLIH